MTLDEQCKNCFYHRKDKNWWTDKMIEFCSNEKVKQINSCGSKENQNEIGNNHCKYFKQGEQK